jgi:creatinine amidohydrolase
MAVAQWGSYEELKPDQLRRIVGQAPVVYWPLGLIEHHGWHLPLGFDGIKARRLCERMAARTGGVLLPVMWWGGEGGHGLFKWSLYQPPEAAQAILRNTVERLLNSGFRCFVLVAGHYPWRRIMDGALPPLARAHPDALFIWGTEMELGGEGLRLPGDHAARWETAYGLALLPELVDVTALKGGRAEADEWPEGRPPAAEGRHPGVVFDAAAPLFAQMGEDARRADAAEAEALVERLVQSVASRVNEWLRRQRA